MVFIFLGVVIFIHKLYTSITDFIYTSNTEDKVEFFVELLSYVLGCCWSIRILISFVLIAIGIVTLL